MGSGATVIVVSDDCAVKVNGGRLLNDQAAWLKRYHGQGVVKVLATWHGGYAMERLDPMIDPITPAELIGLLRSNVWRHKPAIEPDWNTIIAYGELRASQWWGDIRDELVSGLKWCAEARLTQVLTHGDPTFENVMTRSYGDPVLIDPIPSNDHSPDLLAVDLGKILQSACGYEKVMIGKRVNVVDFAFLGEFNDDERRAAQIFALYHIVRLLPYVSDPMMRERIRDVVGENVLTLSV